MRLLTVLSCLAATACGAPDDTDPAPPATEPGGQCGTVSEHDVYVHGTVLQDGEPVEGADIWLEERAWHPGVEVFGRTTSGADGSFAFDARGIVAVQDCWGAALDYVLVGVRGTATGEDPINSSLFGAITDEDYDVDLSLWPLELE